MLPWYTRHGLGRRDSEVDLQSCRRSDRTQSKVDAEDISNSMKKLEPQSLLLLLILLQIPRLIFDTETGKRWPSIQTAPLKRNEAQVKAQFIQQYVENVHNIDDSKDMIK